MSMNTPHAHLESGGVVEGMCRVEKTPLMLVWIAEGCGGVRGVDEHPSRSFGERRGIVGEWQHPSRSFGERRGVVGVWGSNEGPHACLESGGARWGCVGSNEGPRARLESGGVVEGMCM